MTTSKEAIAAAKEIIDISSDNTFEMRATLNEYIERIASIIQKHYAAKDAEIEELKQQSSINSLEWQDWERWSTEVLTDFKIPFDKHKVGMRFALVDFICGIKQERDQLKARVGELEYYFNMMDDTQAQIEIGKLMARVSGLERVLTGLKPTIIAHEKEEDGFTSETRWVTIPATIILDEIDAVLSSPPSSALTRLQELERKAKAFDMLTANRWNLIFLNLYSEWIVQDSTQVVGNLGKSNEPLIAVESAMEKQK